MRNPLRKRFLRELKGEWKKYFVIFVFLTLTIGLVSGVYVANNSMETALSESAELYKLEDGCFELNEEASEEFLNAAEAGETGDVKSYYEEEALRKVDEEVEKEVNRVFEETIREQVTQIITLQTAGLSISRETLDQMIEEQVETALVENESARVEALETALREAEEEALKEVDEEYENSEDARELEDVQSVPVTIYPHFYKQTEVTESSDNTSSTIRIYARQDDIDLASVLSGRLPEEPDEIAIDRMHADNAGLSVGDVLTIQGESFEITGLIAYVNYSTLFEKNTDTMFDALSFDVAMVTEEGWDRVNVPVHYTYAFTYDTEPADEMEEKELSDNLVKILLSNAIVTDNELADYIPRYANQAVQFAPEDMGSDKAMAGALLYILTVVLAFIFALTTNTEIEKESGVIGTLRASGYEISELLRHYITLPALITLAAAVCGNILGYTALKYVVVSMYYNSYSLPAYTTVFTPEALLRTTIIPVVVMLVINAVMIRTKLSLSPLRLIRHDLSVTRRKKAMRLPPVSFIRRFRMRIALQNITDYLILFLGLYFVSVLLVFALGLPETLNHYIDHISETMIADYQVVLKDTEDSEGVEITTVTEGAERFSLTALKLTGDHDEEVSVYGMQEDSSYITISSDLKDNEVMVSSALAEKYNIAEGDELILQEKYTAQTYTFIMKDIYEYDGALSIFTSTEEYNRIFDTEDWSGYLSDKEITDIDETYIAAVITTDDITKVAKQLQHSMGGYMSYLSGGCLVLAVILIYLLTKIIIEKNEVSISMVKILGYENAEIAGLFLLPTTFMTIICEIPAVYLAIITIREYWLYILRSSMDGYLPFVLSTGSAVKCAVWIFAAYLLVMLVDYRRIRKVPMDQVLKNVE